MKYVLKRATEKDILLLKNYKLNSILEYAVELAEEEKNRIIAYVEETIPLQLKQYKMIYVDNKKVGCLLLERKDDGVLLDEIYLEEEYRKKGLGTDILKKVLLENKIIYLWVYKLNTKAISLYTKLGFKIIEETKTRYYMKFSK